MPGDPMGVYIRRDRLNASSQVKQNRFFFLPVMNITPVFPVNPIAPQLPGNDSTNLSGANSPNFGFNIGRQQETFQLSGTWIPLIASDYPTLPSSSSDFDVVLNAQGDTVFGAAGLSDGSPYPTATSPSRVYEVQNSATASATTARANRQRFTEWVADQALGGVAGKFANFRLGLHHWINDGKWVEYKGFITTSSPGASAATYHEQADFSFSFLVCDTLEITTIGA